MGFNFEEYQNGGPYISGDEKKALAQAGIPFEITAVKGPVRKFDNEAYELSIVVPDNDDEVGAGERTLSFPVGSNVESRDRMIAGMKDYLAANEGETITAKVDKIGKAYILVAA